MDTLILKQILSTLMLLCTTGTSGYKSLMRKIPNAAYVMNPCDQAEPWEGIGHLAPAGYGDRNQFGHDFKQHGMEWNKAICELDSDGDGRTNGGELGDPLCVWSQDGTIELPTENITHPGICEPLDSDVCMEKNSWLKCSEGFQCDAIKEPGIKNFTIRLPSLEVPLKQTTHYCMIFDFPQDGDFHMVATQPFLDNKKVMHHILIYGCENDKETKHAVNEPYECGVSVDPVCKDQLSVWLLGIDGECLHSNAGFRIGTNGYKRGGIQIHWENQQHVQGERDSSGSIIYYTENLRPFDAGIMFIGQDYMIIPPGEQRHVETGSCYPECTRRKLSENIYVTFAINHMHYLGKEMKIELLRQGNKITTITDDKYYDFDTPLLYKYENAIEVRPGDEIKTTCIYNSTTRDITTRAGMGYNDEMCFGFLTFYPKSAVTSGATLCTAWKTIPFCQFELDDEVEYCDFRNVHNMSHPATKHVFDQVMRHCRPFGPCYKDCQQVVRDISRMPCYHGNIWEWSRNKISGKTLTNDTVDWFNFYAAVDSCQSETIKGDVIHSKGTSLSGLHVSIVMMFSTVVILTL